MSDVFYLRNLSPPVQAADVGEMVRHAGGCFNLHRVEWVRSFLADDGGRMLCWYRAADAESVRMALRQLGSDMNSVWPGSVRPDARGGELRSEPAAGVAAEFDFDDSLHRETLRAACEAIEQALAAARLDVELSIRSANSTRAVYVLADADPSSVERALRAAAPAPSLLWRCHSLRPPPAEPGLDRG